MHQRQLEDYDHYVKRTESVATNSKLLRKHTCTVGSEFILRDHGYERIVYTCRFCSVILSETPVMSVA